MKHSLLVGVFVIVLATGCSAQPQNTLEPASANVQRISSGIRIEASRKNNDSVGRPLPLLSSWSTGQYSYTYHGRPRGMDPAYQLSLVEKEHHILPAFSYPAVDGGEAALEKRRDYYEAPLLRAAELQLPFSLIGTQWEHILTNDKKYFDLPPDRNPNVVTPDGKVEKKVSPFGPIEHWREVGAAWASSPLMKQLQQWYPDPPQVFLLSNNEHKKLRWHEVETDARYLEKYGKDRDNDFKRRVIADGWNERYRAMQEGMREALRKSWQDKVIFVGYDAFGPAFFGRWGGWTQYSLHSPNRIVPDALSWDGGSPSYYTDDWNSSADFRVYSPQIQSMNWVFMQREARKMNPNFHFELSIWDGQEFNSKRGEQYQPKPEYYRSLGQTYEPPRYAGYAQFGLWLLRPRVLREYRGWTSDLESMEPFYLALAGVVDRVHENDTLKYFWRKGELVPNHAHQHPYQSNIPEEWKDEDRWFLLDTNLDPPRPWKLDTEIPVFSLALVDGGKGSRRWLVYAHSPVEDRTGVKITVPEYGQITVDVPVAGAFYVVNEKDRSISPLN